ncbi:hypothetical protein LJK88_29170 [Paenibacillus sp. P26]|nr:hypothetical protein LJK88_29170 [Paenibacillus sp. P26]UUZ94621.1 hypothetical protein LJK87_08885 [Paenibacillus sp. P25]
MIHVYLDDYRPCPKGFALARNAEECILLLTECDVDILSLDYDLGWGQPNGMQVVGRILETGRFPRRIYLHTSSDGGRMNMYQSLYTARPEGVQVFNGPVPPELLLEIAKTVKG